MQYQHILNEIKKEVDNQSLPLPTPSTSGGSILHPNSALFSRSNSSNIQSANNSTRVQSCFATHSKSVLLGTA